jgi:fructose-1,6-bisphosphatase/inositol monophosphatase family enzyme
MLINFDDYYKNNFEKLKERTRKGIPDSLRGLIWQTFADIEKFRNDNNYKNVYNNLVNDENSDLITESVILRDIDRTFPKHTFFKEKYGLG